MGCAPTVSTITSSGSMPTAKRSWLLRRGEESGSWRYQHWPRGTGGWYRCTAEIAGTHRLHIGDIVKALQQADKTLPSNLENIELEDLPGIADSARRNAEQIETTLTTIVDQPIDTTWVIQVRRELAGLEKAMTRVRNELANNLAKLTSIDDSKSEVERHLVREHRKLTETDDTEMQREIRDRIRKLESVLSDIELERQARIETLTTNRATLRSQINKIRETFRRLLHEDNTLVERIRTLFREVSKELPSHRFSQQSAWQSWHLCLRLPVVGGSALPDKSGLKEWVKRHPQALGRALGNLPGKTAAALPGISVLAPGHVGKDRGLAGRKFVGLGHCCGIPFLVAAWDWLVRR